MNKLILFPKVGPLQAFIEFVGKIRHLNPEGNYGPYKICTCKEGPLISSKSERSSYALSIKCDRCKEWA